MWRAHIDTRVPRSSLLDAHAWPPSLSLPLSFAHVCLLFPPPPFLPDPARTSAPYCQEIFVTESRVVSLGEQATPKVSRLSGPAAPSIRATIIGQLKPGESVRVTCHPIIIRCPRGGSTTYPRDRAWVAATNGDGRGRVRGGGRRIGPGVGAGSLHGCMGGKVPPEGRKAEDGIDYSDHVASDSTVWSSWFFLPHPLFPSSPPPRFVAIPGAATRLSSRSLAYYPPSRKSMRTERPFLNLVTHDWNTPWCHV